ncbi:MAG: putative toxin [Streptosporangiaceae bacterium]
MATVVALVLPSVTASASAAPAAENGVGAHHPGMILAVGVSPAVWPTDRIPSLSGTAAYRIPDELNSSVLGEVNNVSSLSYTNQLRDFAAYAQQC